MILSPVRSSLLLHLFSDSHSCFQIGLRVVIKASWALDTRGVTVAPTGTGSHTIILSQWRLDDVMTGWEEKGHSSCSADLHSEQRWRSRSESSEMEDLKAAINQRPLIPSQVRLIQEYTVIAECPDEKGRPGRRHMPETYT